MTSFALQVGDPTTSPDSLLKPVDLFDPESLGEGIVPEQNPDTTFTAVLESLANSLGSLIKVRDQIKQTGKVSKSMALECLETAPDIELTPIQYYTEVPTAQLGEPTVESITDYLRGGLKRVKEWLIKIWDLITKYATQAFQFADHLFRLYKNKTSLTALSRMKLPDALSDSQSDALLVFIEKNDFLDFSHVIGKDGKKAKTAQYLADYMAGNTTFVKDCKAIFESWQLDEYLQYFKDQEKLIALLNQSSDSTLAELSNSLDAIKESIDSSLLSQKASFFRFSSEPAKLLDQVKVYKARRIKELSSPREDITQLLEKLCAVNQITKSNRFNIGRLFDTVVDNKPESEHEALRLRLTEHVNQLNKINGLVLKLEQEILNYSTALLNVDQFVIQVASVVNKAKGMSSMESISLSQASYNLSMAMESIESSLEDSNIALDDPRFREQASQADTSGITTKIVEWFKHIGKLIAKLINSAIEWFDEATANMIPRITKMLLKAGTIGYESAWKELEKENVTIDNLNKAYAVFAAEGGLLNQNLYLKPRSTFGWVTHDLTDGKFKIADTIISFERYIPSIEKTMRSLVEVSNKLKDTSTSEDVIAELQNSLDSTGFGEISVAFWTQNKEIQEAIAARGNKPAIPSESRQFFSTAKEIYRNYHGMQDRIKKIDALANKLSYLLKDKKMAKLLSIMEKNVDGGLESLINDFSGTINTQTKERPDLEPRMNAYRNLATGIKKSIEALRHIVSTTNSYVYGVYLVVFSYTKIVKESTSFLLNLKYNVANQQFSMQSVEQACGLDDQSMQEDPMAEIEREIAIESYMDQGEDTAQKNMAEGAASSGGPSETSYLNQSGGGDDSEPEDGEGDFNSAMESLENSLSLFKKIQEAKHVDRMLALEAYEYDPTLLGNPKNYSNVNPDSTVVPVALESLTDDIKARIEKVVDWIYKKLNEFSAWLSAAVERTSNFFHQYGEKSVVENLRKRNSNRNTGPVSINELQAEKWFIDSLEKITKLENYSVSANTAIMSLASNGDFRTLDLALGQVDKLLRYSKDIEEVSNLFNGRHALLDILAKGDIDNSPNLASMADNVKTILEMPVTYLDFSDFKDPVKSNYTPTNSSDFAKSLPKYVQARSSNHSTAIAQVVQRSNKLMAMFPAATQFSKKLEYTGSNFKDRMSKIDASIGEEFTRLARLYSQIFEMIYEIISSLNRTIRAIVLMDQAALKYLQFTSKQAEL